MKVGETEIKSMSHAAKLLLVTHLTELADDPHKFLFGGLDLRSPISRDVLRDAENFDIASEYEADELLRYINFEIAKILGKLENQTGVITGKVARNSSGYVSKGAYKL